MKGITPVVAIMLLMAVTVAAAGTFWTLIENQQQEVEDNSPEIDFGKDMLNVENYWYDGNINL